MSQRAYSRLLVVWAIGTYATAVFAQKRNANVFVQQNRLEFPGMLQPPIASAISFGGHASISDTSGQLKAVVGKQPVSLTWGIYDGSLNLISGVPPEFAAYNGDGPDYPYQMRFVPKPGVGDSAILAYINRYTTFPPHMHRLGLLSMDVGEPGMPAGEAQPTINWLTYDIASCFMVVPHASGEDYWIVVQPVGTNAFHAHMLTENGVNTIPVVSYAGPERSIDWQHGQWVPNTQGDRFAYVQRKSAGTGGSLPDTLETELFAFDIAQGLATHLMTLPSRRVQGVEFSSSGRYLYVIEQDPHVPDPGCDVTLVQYDLEASDPPSTRTIVHAYTNPTQWSTLVLVQMLRGNDGRIYCTHEGGGPTLGVIMAPDEAAPLCNYVHDGLTCPSYAETFYQPMKRYHDSPDIITAVAEHALTEMRVAPQPLWESGWLSHPSLEGSLQIRWHDAAGRIAIEGAVQASDGRARINADGLAPGSYAVMVSGGQLAAPVFTRVVVGR